MFMTFGGGHDRGSHDPIAEGTTIIVAGDAVVVI